jgi:hypothetical protein
LLIDNGCGRYRHWSERRNEHELDVAEPPNVDHVDALRIFDSGDRTDSGEFLMAGGSRESGWVRARVACTRSTAVAAEVVLLNASLADEQRERSLLLDGAATSSFRRSRSVCQSAACRSNAGSRGAPMR